jgi:hypothetical protein
VNYKQQLVNEKKEKKRFIFVSCFLTEGNRREGRRPSYAFEYSSPPQIMPPPPPPTSTSAFLASPLTHRTSKKLN